MKLPSELAAVLQGLSAEAASRGIRLAAVGGGVRDGLLGKVVKDLDLALEADSAPFAALCRKRWGARTEPFGEFGTCRVFLRSGLRVDLARARKETYAEPGALPVVRPATLEEDLWRRDFSINAMALVLPARSLLDPTGGRADLKRRLVRVLHPASFRDDPTRVYRAARISARLGFRLEGETRKALGSCVAEGLPGRLSRERLRQELRRLLEEKNPERALLLLRRWGALDVLHPGLRWPAGAFGDPDPEVRLGVLVAAQGRSAEAFLDNLRLDRASARAIAEAAALLRERRAPRGVPLATTLRILRVLRPGLPPAALEPLLAGGEDLSRLGLAPGPSYAKLLSGLARAQWDGRVASRGQARDWLRARALH